MELPYVFHTAINNDDVSAVQEIISMLGHLGLDITQKLRAAKATQTLFESHHSLV